MPLDTVDNKNKKKTRTSTLATDITSRGSSNISTSFESSFVGSQVLSDTPNKYEPYLDLNEHNILLEDINKIRAENQGNFRQFVYGTASGLAKGALGAVENVGLLLDFDSHLKAIQGLDSSEKNWLSEAIGGAKEAIGEALPIYQEDPNKVFDFSDGASYFKAWEGLMDSAIQFAVPGGLIGKAASTGLRATRTAQLIAKLESVSPTFAKVIQGALASSTMNFMEGKVMALEAAEGVRRELADSGLPQHEIDQRAMEAHDQMQKLNLIMMPITMFQMAGIAKGIGYTRNLLKEKGTITNRLKDFGKNLTTLNSDNLISQGLGEAAEEIAQNVMSSESQYQALKGTGKEKGHENLGKRLIEYATNDQALLEGAMGFFGGGPQRIMTEAMAGQYTKEAREQYKERYNAQQAMQEKILEFTKGKFEGSAEFQKEKAEALKNGDIEYANLIDKFLQARTFGEHFQLGTAEFIENTLNDIIQNGATPEQQAWLGDDGKVKAQEMLNNLKQMEKTWLKYADLPTQVELFNNRVQRDAFRESLNEIQSKADDSKSRLQADINATIIPLLKSNSNEEITYNIDSVLKGVKKDLIEEGKTKKPVVRDDSTIENQIIEAVKSKSELLFEHLDASETATAIMKNIAALEKDHNVILSAKGEKDILTKKANFAKAIQAEREIRSTTTLAEAKKVGPGTTLQNHLGKVFKIASFDKASNKITIEDLAGQKRILDKEEFVLEFKNPTTGNYTVREDKKVSEEKAKASAKATQAKSAPQGTPEANVANASQKKGKQTKEATFDDTEPTSNESEGTDVPDAVAKDLAEGRNSSTTVIYDSANNLGDNKYGPGSGDQNISDYLENPKNKIEGHRVKIERTPSDEFPNAIKVTLIDKDGNVITHNNTPIEMFVRENNMSLRAILDKAFENNEVLYTTIDKQYPGYIQFNKGNENLTSLKVALGEGVKVADMEFRIQILGEFVTGELDKAGKPKQDTSISHMIKLDDNNNQEGQVIVKVPTANGSTFPLRLTINKLQEEDANLTIAIYKALLDKVKKLKITSNVSNDPEVLALLKAHPISKFLNADTATFAQVFQYLVHQGKPQAQFPLYYDNFVLHYGIDGKTATLNDIDNGEFKSWLMGVKTRAINWRALNNPKYKEYLVDNEIVQTKAHYNENGIIFANALPSIDITPFLIEGTTTNPSTELETEFEGNPDLTSLFGEGAIPQSEVIPEVIESTIDETQAVEGLEDLVMTELSKVMDREDGEFQNNKHIIINELVNDNGLFWDIIREFSPKEKQDSIIDAIQEIIKERKDCK